MTRTYAILEVSPEAYQEIREKLAAAGYEDQFHGNVIDMHGIAVKAEPYVWERPGFTAARKGEGKY